MNQNVGIILSACITAFVTIIGFIITYFLNKRNFKEEINKQQININLDKIADLPYKIQILMDATLEKKDYNTILKSFKDLMTSIFAYGSQDAISLITNMQELNYLLADTPNSTDKYEVMAYYILLICQVKYDLTGIKINPQYWFRMRLTDYSKTKEILDTANNNIVEKLNLESFLKITQ